MLFRRCHALKHFKRYTEACKDLEEILRGDPNNQNVQKDLEECRELAKSEKKTTA